MAYKFVRNGLRIWLEIIANPPISQGLSLEDKERYLLYFDWEEGKTLCRSQLNPTTKFFEEGTTAPLFISVGWQMYLFVQSPFDCYVN